MKKIIVMRHGKAAHVNGIQCDDERKLLPEGRKRSEKVGLFLAGQNVRVQCVLCSHAIRSRETAHIVADSVGFDKEAVIEHRSIYFGSTAALFDLFYALDDGVEEVLIVGHNPTITEFSNVLLNEQDDWMKTSELREVICDIVSWVDLGGVMCRKGMHVFPAMLQ